MAETEETFDQPSRIAQQNPAIRDADYQAALSNDIGGTRFEERITGNIIWNTLFDAGLHTGMLDDALGIEDIEDAEDFNPQNYITKQDIDLEWDKDILRAESRKEVERIRFQNEVEYAAQLKAQADPVGALGIAVTSALSDPAQMFLPGAAAFRIAGALTKSASATRAIAGMAAAGAAVGVGQAIVSEAAFQSLQNTRTLEQSQNVALASALLGAFLPGAVTAAGRVVSAKRYINATINPETSYQPTIIGADGAPEPTTFVTPKEYQLPSKKAGDTTKVPPPEIIAKQHIAEASTLNVSEEDLSKIDLYNDQSIGAGKTQPSELKFESEALTKLFGRLSGLDGFTNGLSSQSFRGAVSRNPTMRAAVAQLVDSGLAYRVTPEALEMPVQIQIERRVASRQLQALHDIEASIAAFKNEAAEKGLKINRRDFNKAVHTAVVTGQESGIAAADNLAKKLNALFDEYLERATAAGLLDVPKGADGRPVLTGAKNYLTRHYLTANVDKFDVNKLARQFISKNPKLSPRQAKASAQKAIDAITRRGQPVNRDAETITSKFTRERELDVDDAWLIENDLISSDIQHLVSQYIRRMERDIAFNERFGDGKASKLREQIVAKANELGHSDKQLQADLKTFDNLVSMARGEFGLYANATADNINLIRAAKVLDQATNMAFLGIAPLRNIFEAVHPVFNLGLSKAFKHTHTLLKALPSDLRSASAAQNRKMGIGADYALAALRMADPEEAGSFLHRDPTLIRGINRANVMYQKYADMTYITNDFLQRWAGHMTQLEILEASRRIAAGSAKKGDVEFLFNLGIEKSAAMRIGKSSITEDRGFLLANLDQWDSSLAELFKDATYKNVKRINVNSKFETAPVFQNSIYGRAFGKFVGIVMSINQKVILAGLQQRPASAVAGLMGLFAAGYFRDEFTRAALGKKDVSEEDKTYRALTASGILGLYGEIGNRAYSAVRYNLTYGKNFDEKAAAAAAVQFFGGATGSYAMKLGQAIFGGLEIAFTGKTNSARIDAMEKVIPASNLIYTQILFDEVEDGLRKKMGYAPQER